MYRDHSCLLDKYWYDLLDIRGTTNYYILKKIFIASTAKEYPFNVSIIFFWIYFTWILILGCGIQKLLHGKKVCLDYLFLQF